MRNIVVQNRVQNRVQLGVQNPCNTHAIPGEVYTPHTPLVLSPSRYARAAHLKRHFLAFQRDEIAIVHFGKQLSGACQCSGFPAHVLVRAVDHLCLPITTEISFDHAFSPRACSKALRHCHVAGSSTPQDGLLTRSWGTNPMRCDLGHVATFNLGPMEYV